MLLVIVILLDIRSWNIIFDPNSFSVLIVIVNFVCRETQLQDQRGKYYCLTFVIVTFQNACPEEYSSFYFQITYEWLTSFIWRGYQKTVTFDDLYELNEKDTIQNLLPEYLKHRKAAELSMSKTFF